MSSRTPWGFSTGCWLQMADGALPLIGHGDAEHAFLKALEGGRLHHAWIIEGPSGIGKARFVTRLSAMLLGAKGTADDPLAAPSGDPVIQKVLSSSHPDLKHVSRELNEKGVLKQDIAVDQIRALNHFFSLKPALGGWRIGILDSIDEMNTNGLNAVLKTLEEPPARAILFLISHATKPVLATIRSRCQTLRLGRLNEADTLAVLRMQDEASAEQVAELVKGRPGRAEALTGAKVLAAAQAARTLLAALPRLNDAHLAAAIQAAAEDDAAFAVFAEEILGWIDKRAQDRPELSRLWFESQNIVAAQRSLHLTPTQAASKLVAGLQSASALV